MNNDTRRDARLILRAGAEPSHEIVELNQAHRHETHGFDVNSTAESGRERILR